MAVAIVFAFNKRADVDWLRSELFFVSITVARSTNETLLPTPPCLCFVTPKIFSTAFLSDFSRKGIAGTSLFNSTRFQFKRNNALFFLKYDYRTPDKRYYPYSCLLYQLFHSCTFVDGMDGMVFQLYLFAKSLTFHVLYCHSVSSYS